MKSVWENATTPSQCALAPPVMPWRHPVGDDRFVGFHAISIESAERTLGNGAIER